MPADVAIVLVVMDEALSLDDPVLTFPPRLTSSSLFSTLVKLFVPPPVVEGVGKAEVVDAAPDAVAVASNAVGAGVDDDDDDGACEPTHHPHESLQCRRMKLA